MESMSELEPIKGYSRERTDLLEHLRSCENREFERLARRALERITDSDVDFVYPHPLEKTLLDVACCEGRESRVESLLVFGADPNRINEAHNRTPLHFAAELGHHRVIERLFEDPRTNPNIRVGEQTALHLAVRNGHSECVRVILEKGRADPNLVNSKGVTPIHIAASTGQREMVRLVLAASKFPVDLDEFPDFRKLTTRDLVAEKMPDLELPPPLAAAAATAAARLSNESRPSLSPLILDEAADQETTFLNNTINARDQREIEESLKIAARRNYREAAAQLARKGQASGIANFGEAPARIAVQLGHADVLREILKVDPELANKLLLPAAQELGVPTWPKRGENDNDDDRVRVLRLIMQQPEVDTRREDDKGNTALHYAARAESLEAVKSLLRSGSYIGHRNLFGVPPLAHLSPSNLADFFDECLSSENDRTDEFEIEFDYRCLMPSSSSSEMDALAFIAENRGLKPLLKHPLLSSFLYLKWHRVRYVFYTNFIFYLIFYFLINSYVLTINYDSVQDSSNSTGSGTTTTARNETTVESIRNNEQRTTTSPPPPLLGYIGFLALIGLVILTIRESLQLVSSPRRYLTSMENIPEVTLVVVAGWFIASPNPQIGAIIALLSAWQLVLLIGQHPRMSTGIEMFKTVSVNFVQFLFLYAFLILAFALAFYTLFKGSEGDVNFPDPGHSLFKTIIMLTGEFDANDIPFVSRPVISHCVFVLFVFLIAIVLFNLLNGLAVSDTADILNKSELVSLVSRTKVVSYAESIASGLDRFAIAPCRLLSLGTLAARIIRLFPDYLPRAKIAVRPYKSNEIRIYGRGGGGAGGSGGGPLAERKTDSLFCCTRFSMDPSIVGYAKEVLKRRGQITENERTIGALDAIERRLETLLTTLARIEFAMTNNNGVVVGSTATPVPH